jgi:hypothetical protein
MIFQIIVLAMNCAPGAGPSVLSISVSLLSDSTSNFGVIGVGSSEVDGEAAMIVDYKFPYCIPN